MIDIKTPISEKEISNLDVGDMIKISGYIITGRDAVLPKIVKMIQNNEIKESDINLKGGVVFHTAVSPAGVGPTSSNKLEIEGSMEELSKAGVKIHLGKGALKKETVEILQKNNSVFAVIPPVTALLKSKTIEKKVLAFPEEGMEALHLIKVVGFPAIIAVAKGESIFWGEYEFR